jgi:hypothetical protein
MKLLITRLGVFLSFVALPLSAHHGKDFLLVESYELPHPGAIYAVSAEEFLFDRSALTFHDEPSLLFGMTDRIAAEVHAHVAKEPRSAARLEAIAPAVHLRLFDCDSLHAALSAEYEIGRHGAGNVAAVRFIVGHPVGEGAFVGNIGVQHGRDGTRAIYAVSYRPDMEAARSWGVEAQGALHRGEQHQAILAGYGQISERLTVKAGVGAAFGVGKPLALVRTGIVWRF